MASFDSFSSSFIPQIQRPRESLLHSLRERERGANRTKSHVIAARRLYRSIHPNTTIHGVDCQFSNLKKFTPCGQYLIGMSKNYRAVHIYRFKGSGNPPEERMTESIRFKDFFELKHETLVPKESELLSKDFCLVTANGRFIIVAAVSPNTGTSSDNRMYPCSLSCIPNLETIVFYVVELETGKIVDKREFKNESITVPHHLGVSLYDSLFAVMLIQSQAIQIIHIKSNGKMIDLHRIGWFNHEDDELVLARYRDFNENYLARQTIKSASPYYHLGYNLKDEDMGDLRTKDRLDSFALAPTMPNTAEFSVDATYHQVPSSSSSSIGHPSRPAHPNQSFISQLAYNNQSVYCDEPHSQMISGIKQRLMAYLFRKAFNADDGGAALRHFHLTFHQFANLTMWRMQLLDESTLLIKFGKLDCVVGRPADSTYQTAFFVFYDIRTTEILAVYDNASEEFLKLYEAWADQFCATAYTTAGRDKRHYSSTCSNNIYAKDNLKKTQYGMRHARNGGIAQAIKRSLCVLPYSPQSLSDSPYLDQALFSYDEKVVSASDRQRPCQDFPIKFYLRGSGQLRFKIHLFKPGSLNGNNNIGNSSSNVNRGEAFNSMAVFDPAARNNNMISHPNHNGIGIGNNIHATININNNNNNNNINHNNAGDNIGNGTINTNMNMNMNMNINMNVNMNMNMNNNSTNNNTTAASNAIVRSKRFVTFIPHPFEPFIISVIQIPSQPPVLNLHLYRSDAEPL
ncbi:acid phosphatase det1 [Lobosporangium transversale]|uniref:De-etiolated protein 1 Det1-domain-containing protein n=1 Tax=Lobosporangium transversale TaxID=64571 RepID=A0A1Y2GQQ4_9FUNG|nr:De-etiolated protein 1 Det1-domain-containing protein [Lobosporangium transversale]KAF9899399.1 acid phosphatase det1 [Lobosporangium transversale]ORZ19219.1 De-etiolated protein 1 Det1-domain-containing protein [Lobosporangium transversale]|eukprot:XP_021882387.1 De-etiolated protein 1 Det1-domain-containing protein [Lobosporangium transversale]